MQDLLVIGGGINGAGIARDAAGRGLSVTLCEKDDLAAHTSSASTKLVHGGLRYLEYGEFRLVREALREREVLLANAPHIIWPMRFVLPHDSGVRPAWMLRAGLFLYDLIGGHRTLPASHGIRLDKPPHSGVLQARLTKGFEYSDCWVEDSRLVVLNAMDAHTRGADIRTRCEVTRLDRAANHWTAHLRHSDGREDTLAARALVNAAGPWVDQVARSALGQGTPARLRLVKGSHIIVPRIHPGDFAYIFQQPDKRIVFAIPYERDFTLIGTTDMGYDGPLDDVAISPEERAYLREAAGRYFTIGITEDDIVHTYSGVRPLYEDDAADNATVTRDYVFELDVDGGAPVLSVYGGKITTYRKLAEHALARLLPALAIDAEEWTRDAPLPGGDMGDFPTFLWNMGERYGWLPPETLLRLARAYGTRMARFLAQATTLADLGPMIVADLSEAELRYLVTEEFARDAEDVLWRRSKLGLHCAPDARKTVQQWIDAHAADCV